MSDPYEAPLSPELEISIEGVETPSWDGPSEGRVRFHRKESGRRGDRRETTLETLPEKMDFELPEEAAERREQAELVHSELLKMNNCDAIEVLKDHVFAGKTIRTIADEREISVGQVRSHLQRALVWLRKRLAPYYHRGDLPANVKQEATDCAKE